MRCTAEALCLTLELDSAPLGQYLWQHRDEVGNTCSSMVMAWHCYSIFTAGRDDRHSPVVSHDIDCFYLQQSTTFSSCVGMYIHVSYQVQAHMTVQGTGAR